MNASLGIAGLVLLLAGACAQPPAAATLRVVVHVPARTESTADPDAVVIDIETRDGVDYRSVLVEEFHRSNRSEVTLDGQPFGMEGDVLLVHGARYGPLRPGMVVRIGSAGVLIDGRRAEPLR